MKSSISNILREFHAGWRRLTGILFVGLSLIGVIVFDGLPDASAGASASFYNETDYSNSTTTAIGEGAYETKKRVSVGNWDFEFTDHGEIVRTAYLNIFDPENGGISYLPYGQRIRLSSIPTYRKAIYGMACMSGTVNATSAVDYSVWIGSRLEGFKISCYSWPFVTNIFLSITLISFSPFLCFIAWQWIRNGFRR